MKPDTDIPRETLEKLLGELTRLRDTVTTRSSSKGLSTRAMSEGTECGLRLAAAALGAAVLIGGVWWSTTAIVGWVAGVNLFAGAASATAFAGVKAAAGGVVLTVSGPAIGLIIAGEYDRTKMVCKAALR